MVEEVVDAEFAFKTLKSSGFIQFGKLGVKIKTVMKIQKIDVGFGYVQFVSYCITTM